MVKQAQTVADPRRRGRRVVGLMAFPLVIAALFTVALLRLWVVDTNEIETSGTRTHGVAYLTKLTDLMDRVIEAQSVSVGSGRPDAQRIQDGIRSVDSLDLRYSAELSTTSRWTFLRDQLSTLVEQHPTGDAAYRGFTSVVQLFQDLIADVADRAHLSLDADPDSHYLVSAALRLPQVSQFASRAADIAQLATRDSDRVQSEVRIGAARYQVALSRDAIIADLHRAIEQSASSGVGRAITEQLGGFQFAVDRFVPPVTLVQGIDRVDVATLSDTANGVRGSVHQLVAAVLGQLDRRLQTDVESAARDRLRTVLISLLAVLLTAILLWLMAAVARDRSSERGSAGELGEPGPGGSGLARPGAGAPGMGGLGTAGPGGGGIRPGGMGGVPGVGVSGGGVAVTAGAGGAPVAGVPGGGAPAGGAPGGGVALAAGVPGGPAAMSVGLAGGNAAPPAAPAERAPARRGLRIRRRERADDAR